MPRPLIERVAYHEAGHAVASIAFGRAFAYVTIVPEEASLGHLHHGPSRVTLCLQGAPTKTERWLERSAMISLAGPAAEAQLTGRYDHRGASSDYASLADTAMRLYEDEDVANKFYAFMTARARCFVRNPNHWIQIEALAEALLERKTLRSREAKAVCLASHRNRERFQKLVKADAERYDARQRELRKKWEALQAV